MRHSVRHAPSRGSARIQINRGGQDGAVLGGHVIERLVRKFWIDDYSHYNLTVTIYERVSDCLLHFNLLAPIHLWEKERIDQLRTRQHTAHVQLYGAYSIAEGNDSAVSSVDVISSKNADEHNWFDSRPDLSDLLATPLPDTPLKPPTTKTKRVAWKVTALKQKFWQPFVSFLANMKRCLQKILCNWHKDWIYG